MRIAALFALTACAALRVPLPAEAELHRAQTDDGWSLSLVRYPARGPVTGVPVLLCHGISANDRNMDLDERHSLARWFAAHGREAWTLSLRGTGGSDRPDSGKGREVPSFDDYWRRDLPAALAEVRRVSGAATIDYVGHSMGGMLVYAYLSQGGQGLNAVATLGSPTRLDWGSELDRLLPLAKPFVSPRSTLPSELGAWLSVPMQGAADGPFARLFYNPENTSALTFKRLMAYGSADTSGRVAQQFIEVLESGRFRSLDGIDFKAGMARVRTPVLVVAGRLDRIALTPAVRDGFDALGGPKEWLLVTRANGAHAEYGHMDLVIGDRAPDEVWSRVLAFFAHHAAAR